MATKTDIELALAELEAGKFSFRMVETVKTHVETLESDLARVTGDYESAANTLRQQEFTISRLEADLRKANGRVHTLVKANAFSEAAVRETKKGAVMVREHYPVVRAQAVVLMKKALTFLAHLDLKAEADKVKAHPLTQKALAFLAKLDLQAEWKKFRTHPLTEKALREAEPVIARAYALTKQYAPVVQKQASALIDKASACVAQLQKKTA